VYHNYFPFIYNEQVLFLSAMRTVKMPPSSKKAAFYSNIVIYYFALAFSQAWLATPQLVLQADWQEVWHSPQPPFFALLHKSRVSKVLMCFISINLQDNSKLCEYTITPKLLSQTNSNKLSVL